VPLTNIDHDEIKAILSEYRIANADVAIRQPNATADDLVDVVEGNRVYIPAIYVSSTHASSAPLIIYGHIQVLNKARGRPHPWI